LINFKVLIMTFSLLGLLLGCAEEKDDTVITKYIGCTKALENQGECIRWMDRKIYFAFSSGSTPSRNNEFDKATVKEVLEEISESTMLGQGYFQFTEVDEGLLNPIIEPGL